MAEWLHVHACVQWGQACQRDPESYLMFGGPENLYLGSDAAMTKFKFIFVYCVRQGLKFTNFFPYAIWQHLLKNYSHCIKLYWKFCAKPVDRICIGSFLTLLYVSPYAEVTLECLLWLYDMSWNQVV